MAIKMKLRIGEANKGVGAGFESRECALLFTFHFVSSAIRHHLQDLLLRKSKLQNPTSPEQGTISGAKITN